MRIFKRVIAVFIVVLTAFLLVPKGKADSEYMPSGSKTDFYDYDNDVNAWEKYTSSTEKLDNYLQTYQEDKSYDDEIEEIIPYSCFAQRGTHLHIGIKYGFYVYTTKNGDKYNNKSEVLIFKITRNLNKNPNGLNNNTNTKGATNLTYAVFTQFKPVLSNNYTYRYSTDYDVFVIESKNTKNDIAINYANNYLTSSYINTKKHEDDNWTAVRALVIDNSQFEANLDECIKYGINTVGDILAIVLKYYGMKRLGSIIKTIVKNGVNLLVSLVRGKADGEEIASRLNDICLDCLKLSNDDYIVIKAEIAQLIKNFTETTIDKATGKTPSLSTMWDTACEAADLFIKECAKKSISPEEAKDISEYISFIEDIGDAIGDGIQFLCYGIASILSHDKAETQSNVIYGQTSCGYQKKNDVRILAEKQERVSFYNYFSFNTYDLKYDNYFDVTTELQFRNGKDNYKSVSVTYKMKLYDEDYSKVYLKAPYKEDFKYTNKNVAVSDGSKYQYAYFIASFDGEYTVDVYTDAGQDCSYKLHKVGYNVHTSSLQEGVLYEFMIYTSNLRGNHFIHISMKGLPTTYKETTTFDCSRTGYYTVELTNNSVTAYLNITSASYKQTYYFSSYSYTRWTDTIYRKSTERSYLVYFEKDKSYSISYVTNIKNSSLRYRFLYA